MIKFIIRNTIILLILGYFTSAVNGQVRAQAQTTQIKTQTQPEIKSKEGAQALPKENTELRSLGHRRGDQAIFVDRPYYIEQPVYYPYTYSYPYTYTYPYTYSYSYQYPYAYPYHPYASYPYNYSYSYTRTTRPSVSQPVNVVSSPVFPPPPPPYLRYLEKENQNVGEIVDEIKNGESLQNLVQNKDQFEGNETMPYLGNVNTPFYEARLVDGFPPLSNRINYVNNTNNSLMLGDERDNLMKTELVNETVRDNSFEREFSKTPEMPDANATAHLRVLGRKGLFDRVEETMNNVIDEFKKKVTKSNNGGDDNNESDSEEIKDVNEEKDHDQNKENNSHKQKPRNQGVDGKKVFKQVFSTIENIVSNTF
ncbi:hypothetical protein HWI79_1021 [Cryptosporidium felis]|nr:hypothetical protein HWI79_1021 [Cryptosporidium felis]